MNGCYMNPPYYLSAYALARKRGFKGTEEDWLRSLMPQVGIGEVKTLECGEEAQVSMSGPADAPLLNFGLPKGEDGCHIWKNTPFRLLKGRQDRVQMSAKADGTKTEQEGCSQILKCPKFLGWHLEGESRMWLYIGDVVDGEFVRDPAYDIAQTSNGSINYLNPSHNRFIVTDGTKYFWYKAVDEGVKIVGAEEFPVAMEAPAVVPDFVTNEGSHKTSGDYYSIVIPSGSDYAVLVKDHDTNTMNVSWDTAEGTVVSKGASFGSIPENAGAALLRIPNDCPLENVRVYCSKSVTGRTQRPAARNIISALTNFQWISRKGVLWNDATATYFDDGHRFTGIPYSSRWFNAHYLGYEISPTTLANALNDPYSIAYDGGQTKDGIWSVSGKSEIDSNGGTGYGLVCSVLQCLLSGNPYPQSNRGFTFDSNFRVVPAAPAPGAMLLNKGLTHSVLLDEVYDKGYSFIEAEDPCSCRTVHTNGMEKPNYLQKKTKISALDDYAYTVANTDVSGYQKNLLDFDGIEVPNGAVRPWRGHKAVYGPYDKSENGSGIGLTLHNAGIVRLFIPGVTDPVVFSPLSTTKYLDISGSINVDGTYTVDSGDGTVQEQFRYFGCDPVSLHFTEDGTAIFSESKAEYAYVKVTGYGTGFNPGAADGVIVGGSSGSLPSYGGNSGTGSLEEESGTMVIAAGQRYPDLAKDTGRIKSFRAVMASDPTEGDCWGRYSCVSGIITSDYREDTGGGGGNGDGNGSSDCDCFQFNGGYTDNEGYLHLTMDGEDVEEFTPAFVGVGGAGGAYGSTIKLTCGLDSRIFSILASQETCIIPYTWSSLDATDGSSTGKGTASWTVNGSRVAVQKIDQGDCTFDIRKYLTDGEENEIVLTVADAYGTTKNMVFSISVTSFGLSWNLTDMAYHKADALAVRLTPTGSGNKTLKVSLDGSTIHSEVVTTSGRTVSVNVPAQLHGAHTILAWVETEVEGDILSTEPLRHVGVWTSDGALTKIVAVYEPSVKVSQYGTAQIRFMVVDPAAETAVVTLTDEKGGVTALGNVARTVQIWAYKARNQGSYTLKIGCGGISANVELTVSSLGYDIQPVTNGLVLDIDPAGHSNTEASREQFGYTDGSGINHPFAFSENFDWTGGGFQTDDQGVTAFVVKRGTYVTADCSLFSDDPKKTGKNLKLIFKAENVRNYDAVLMDCMSVKVGIRLQAQQATVGSETESMTIPYCEGKKVEMDVNIEAETEDSLAYICLKAIPSCKPVRYGTTDSWTQTGVKLLTIGSEDADVWIYRVKMYGNSLNRFEMLDNYIADCGDPEEMVARYERNDIFNDDGTIGISKLNARNAQLRTVHIRAKRMTTGKDDEVPADVEIIYTAGGESHHLIAQNVVFKAQGTSSLEYILAALNLDLDFSRATSWVNGKGESIASYAFTENSIPVDYFNLKADVASSESANNVVLCDDYNEYNPVTFAGKTGGVRDCIEGHPCAVFFTNTSGSTVSIGARSVAAGETVLYFAGNMNNSKKNFQVFGWDNEKWPEQCCVEILNNISLQCRFRSDDLSTETWDGAEGTSNFEFAFPKNPTAAMKAKFAEMLSWVVSTAQDLATNEALPQAVVYGGNAYVVDNAAYRAAKFLAEFENYFVKDQMLFHYLFTERHCMSDNRSKNVFLCYDYYEELGGYRWSVRRNYDNDTAEGCDNSGGATFTYGLELDDIVGDSHVYNANDNTIWQNISKLMYADLLRVYKSNKDAWDSVRIRKKFNDYQAVTPEALRIEDMWNKYFAPLLLAGEESFLKRCHGDKEPWREQFEEYQGVYMDSKYCDTSDRENCISLRATVTSAEAGNIDILPYSDLYITVMYGTNGTVRIRAKRNMLYTVQCPTDSLTDTETYIFSASHLKELGSLAKLKTKFVTLTQAKKLQVLPIGSGDSGYQNLNMTELGLGNNTLLEYLDIRGLPNLTGLMDLSSLTSLEEIYANGSGITGLILAKGAPVRIARIPAVASFTGLDLQDIESFSMDGSGLLSLWVEGSPAIDTLALCKAATGLTRGRLIDVDWTDENADVLTRLALLQTNGGMDAQGNVIDGFVLTGKCHCTNITQEEINLVTAAFPELMLTYGEIVTAHTVTFKNWDGQTLRLKDGSPAVFTVRHGGTAINPVTAGLMDTPVRESTVGETFSYLGWDLELPNVVSDRTFTAVFYASTRYYTVNFWYDEAESSLLESHRVAAFDKCEYGGHDLEKADGSIWAGWDNDVGLMSVEADLEVHALFLTPVLPATAAAEYDYLYSNDPADKSAYTAQEFWGILYYGRQKEYFAIGDRIKMACDSDAFTDTEVILELRSWKHFMSAERVGEWAGPYFGMVGLMNTGHCMNTTNVNAGGFAASDMNTYLQGTVYGELPTFFRKIIEKIEVLSSAGTQSAEIVKAESYLTLESSAELGQKATENPYAYEVAEGADEITFAQYTDTNSRKKSTLNGTGSNDVYWTRSPISTSIKSFLIMNNGAAGPHYERATDACRYSFGFCLKADRAE